MISKNKEFIKSISIVLITEAFLYFIIKNFVNQYNLVNDFGITFPLIKEFVYIYNSWYPFVFFTSYLIYIKDKEDYKKFVYVMVIGILLSHLTFLLYPSMVIRPEIKVNNFTDLVLFLTYYFDTPAINCIPSVHCLLCYISIYYIIINKKIALQIKIPIVIYYILIILSTLFIKQHLLIDAIIALIYTCIGITVVKLFYPKIKKILKFIF